MPSPEIRIDAAHCLKVMTKIHTHLDLCAFRPGIRCWSLLLTAIIATSAISQETESPAETSAKTLIPIQNGGVDCNQLFDAVSKDLHWVAGSVSAFTRGRNSQNANQISAATVDELVKRFPTVFSYQQQPSQTTKYLAVDVDRLAEILADRKSRLRSFLAKAQNTELASLYRLESTWQNEVRNPPRVLVVLSGLNSTAASSEAVATELHRRTNLPTCVFAYPNDGPIAESAGMLALGLRDFHQDYPASRVTLITHSMGGLLARAALEFPVVQLREAGTLRNSSLGVDQLIQICPPNHGSALAEYGPLLEPVEQIYRLVQRRSSRESRVLFRAIVDGFNEASADLKPDSKFLTNLNALDRNPQVRYTILAGSDGPLASGVSGLLATVWDEIALVVDEPSELDNRIRDVLNCDELQRGKGDGVVSLKSAKLSGVDDHVILNMHHLVWEQLDSSAGKRMLSEVASRLGISL